MRSDEALKHDDVSVTIKLENGEHETFNYAEELAIPQSNDELKEEARRVPAMLAFWLHQQERCLRDLRTSESNLEQLESETYFTCRENMRNNQRFGDVTEKMVAHAMSWQPEVIKQKTAVKRKKHQYQRVRALADAMRIKCDTVSRLVSQMNRNTGE